LNEANRYRIASITGDLAIQDKREVPNRYFPIIYKEFPYVGIIQIR